MPAAVFAAAAVIGAEFVGAAVLGTAFSLTGTILAKAAFSAALSLVAETMRETPQAASPISSDIANRKQLIRASAGPRRAVYGSVGRLSGNLLYVSNGTDTNYVHFVVALASHSCQAINDCYLGDEKVGALDAGGNCIEGRFSGYVRIKKYLGSLTQLTDPDLAAECPDWGAKARPGKGITYVYLRLKRSRDVFPQGIPTPRFDVLGKNDILDVRTGLYGYTTNAALCTLDYTLWKYGFASGIDEVEQNSWIAAANVCDEDVAVTGGGTQKRYAINGTFTLDKGRAEVLDSMRQAMAGAAFYTMGLWYGHAGAASAPVMDISERDLRGPIRVRPRVSDDKVYNAVKGTYTETTLWTETDFPPVTNSTYETQDGGQRITKDIKLPFEIDADRAQRLAKTDLERHRQGVVVELPMRIKGLKLRPWNVVRLSLTKMGWANKLFRVVEWNFNLIGGADLVLEEYADAIYTWSSSEATAVDTAPDTALPSPFAIDAPASVTVSSASMTSADGSLTHRLRVAWATPSNAYIRSGTIQYRLTGATAWRDYPVEDPSQGEAIISPLAEGAYDVRMRWETSFGPRSQWTTTSGTAAAAPTAPAAATALTLTAGLFKVHLALTYGDARHDVFGEFWAATTNDRATATRVGLVRWPATEADHAGLAAGQTWYYWARISDTSGNESAWYPASATAGIASAATSDPSALLTQLQAALGMPQLAAELAAPIALLIDPANLAHPTSEAAAAIQTAAEGMLQLLVQADALRDRSRIEQWVTTNTIEMSDGVIRLLATAEISTDVEAQLRSAQIARSGLDASVVSHTTQLGDHGGRLDAAETDITQMQGDITLKASSAYVDATVDNALSHISPDAVASNTQLLAEGTLQALLDLDAAQNSAWAGRARIAIAERTLTTQADALTAAAVERLILDARMSGNEAAAVVETSARVAGDSANASQITTLAARLNTGDFATVKTTAEATANAMGDVEAKWGVQVQTMNDGVMAVAGIQLLSGADSETVFAILADKLLAYKPDGTGTPVQMLSLGTYNGQTVFLLNGGIVAQSLAVDTLSAITANIGLLRMASTGARMEISSDAVRGFDAADVERVRVGKLGAL